MTGMIEEHLGYLSDRTKIASYKAALNKAANQDLILTVQKDPLALFATDCAVVASAAGELAGDNFP